MSGYLGRIARELDGSSTSVRPRLPSRFEPAPSDAMSFFPAPRTARRTGTDGRMDPTPERKLHLLSATGGLFMDDTPWREEHDDDPSEVRIEGRSAARNALPDPIKGSHVRARSSGDSTRSAGGQTRERVAADHGDGVPSSGSKADRPWRSVAEGHDGADRVDAAVDMSADLAANRSVGASRSVLPSVRPLVAQPAGTNSDGDTLEPARTKMAPDSAISTPEATALPPLERWRVERPRSVPDPVRAATSVEVENSVPVIDRAEAPARRPRRREAGEPPVVRITIGRIEVRAVPPTTSPPAMPTPARRSAPTPMTLQEYLERRNGQGP